MKKQNTHVNQSFFYKMIESFRPFVIEWQSLKLHFVHIIQLITNWTNITSDSDIFMNTMALWNFFLHLKNKTLISFFPAWVYRFIFWVFEFILVGWYTVLKRIIYIIIVFLLKNIQNIIFFYWIVPLSFRHSVEILRHFEFICT